MKMLRLAIIAGATLAATPAFAQSKDLAFTTISKSSMGGQTNPAQLVIEDQNAYDKFFNGSAPLTPAVDFTSEDVLAVAMGTEPTSGYAIEIERVEYMTTGITGGTAFVHVKETTPAPGTMVAMHLTSPVHVIKVAKQASHYVFVGVSKPFDTLSLQIFDPRLTYTKTLTLDSSGNARIEKSSPTARYAPIVGQAKAAELAAVTAALAAAQVDTLPGLIPDTRLMKVAPHKIELTSTVNGTAYTLDASYDFYLGYQTRVKPLVDALERIMTRVMGGVLSPFDSIELHYQGGFVAFSDTLTLAKDGTFTLSRFGFRTNTTTLYTGQATQSELDAVVAAFNQCDVATLPASIVDPTPIMDIPSLEIDSTIGGQSYTTNVAKAGFYDSYDARLRPLVDDVRAIGDRIVSAAQDQTITDVVVLGSGSITIGAYTIDATDPFYTLLAAEVGLTVTIDANVQGSQATVLDVQATMRHKGRIHKSASASSKTVGSVAKGDAVKITSLAKNGLWLEVEANGKTGWLWHTYAAVGH